MNRRLVVRKDLIIAALPIGIVLTTSIVYLNDLSVWRSIIGYFSFCCFCIASFLFFQKRGVDEFFEVIKIVIWSWLFFAALDFIFRADVTHLFKTIQFDELGEGRGVNSLATEPSYYGLICFFIFLVLEVMEAKRIPGKYKKLKFLLFFQIFFLAQSAITVLYVILYYTLKLCSKRANLKYVILSVIVFAFLVFFLARVDLGEKGPRIIKLFLLVIENPTSILMLDLSINHRFNHVFFSLLASFDNYLLPNSIVHWSSAYDLYASKYSDWVIWSPPTSRIMSGYGSMFFELGIIGLSIVFLLSNGLRVALKGTGASMRFILFINIIMFSAIPIAFPPFGFLIGFLYSNKLRIGSGLNKKYL